MVVVAISGVGGTGKTETARVLVEKLNKSAKKADERYRLVMLNALASRVKAFKSYDSSRKSRIVNMQRLEAELKKLRKEHKNLVVEGLFAHDFKADVVVVLRCEPIELERRLRKKYTWHTKIQENVEAEMMGIITGEAMERHGKSRVFEVDTSRRRPDETADIVKEIVDKRPKEHRAGSINWLGKSWYIRRIFRRPRRPFSRTFHKGHKGRKGRKG